MAARIERERAEREAATGRLQYPRYNSKRLLFTTVIVAAGAEREARGRPGGLAHGRARGKGFPS